MTTLTLSKLGLVALSAAAFTSCATSHETAANSGNTNRHDSPAAVGAAPSNEPARVYDAASERFVRTPPFGQRGNRSDI